MHRIVIIPGISAKRCNGGSEGVQGVVSPNAGRWSFCKEKAAEGLTDRLDRKAPCKKTGG